MFAMLLVFFTAASGLVCSASRLQGEDSSDPVEAASDGENERDTEPDNEAETPVRARVVRVSIPIIGNQDKRVKRMINQLLADWPAREERPVLILEFWPPPNTEQGRGSEFERCLSLARYLAGDQLSRVRTVAYLPRSICGHAVLPALACEEIIAHPEATLGRAGIDEAEIDATIRQGYREIAERRRTVPSALALGMLDSQLAVYQATTPDGIQFVTEQELAALQAEGNVLALDTLVANGDWGEFTGTELRLELGVASRLVADRRQLSEALQIPVDQVDLDPSLDKHWKPIRADLVGPINKSLVDATISLLDKKIHSDDINFICVWIDSGGGSAPESGRLAHWLSRLDSTQVRTVAYVDGKARADAAIIAMACDHLVMRDEAVLGGSGEHAFTEDEISDLTKLIEDLADEKSRPWSPMTAMIDAKVELHRWQVVGSSLQELMSADEVAQMSDPEKWRKGQRVSPAGDLLKLDGLRAEELDLAHLSVANYEEFREAYQLADDPALVQPNWAHNVIRLLAAPHVAASLLGLAFWALIIEMWSPGTGLGGFVSVVCFVLYFWAQFLHGTADMLEILLFVMGMGCIAAEIFVLPGFGVFGIGGFALLMVSLVLASQTFVVPRNDYQWSQLPGSMLMVTAPVAGVVAGLFFVGRYMNRAPVFRHMMLVPPDGDSTSEQSRRESLVDYVHLVNMVGVATTPIAPSGKARFGDQLVNVTSDGEVIAAARPVKVVEVQSNRVVVTLDTKETL